MLVCTADGDAVVSWAGVGGSFDVIFGIPPGCSGKQLRVFNSMDESVHDNDKRESSGLVASEPQCSKTPLGPASDRRPIGDNSRFLTDLGDFLASYFHRRSSEGQLSHVVMAGDVDDGIMAHLQDLLQQLSGASEAPDCQPVRIVYVSRPDLQDVLTDPVMTNIEDALFILFVDDRHCLPSGVDGLVARLSEFENRFGSIVLVSSHSEPDRLLSVAAQTGLFPRAGCSHIYPEAAEKPLSLHWFECRPYKIRHPQPRDLGALIELEMLCWSPARRSTAEDIEHRILVNPAGQCVLEADGKIVGAIYSQCIATTKVLYEGTSTDVSRFHVPGARLVQLLAVNVHPDRQSLGLGDQLLEFMLQYSGSKDNVEGVVAVSLCKDYPSHNDLSMEAYIEARDEQGLLIDPILRFHDCHGAQISGLLAGYRPADTDNRGNGVLVRYDIHQRRPRDPMLELLPSDESQRRGKRITVAAVPALVEEEILSILGDARKASYVPERSIMDMGLDSLDLMRLRARLSTGCGLEINATFFFQYCTAMAVTRTLQQLVGAALANGVQVVETAEVASTTGWQRSACEEGAIRQDSQARCPAELEDAVAIIGIGCRFPGHAGSPDAFWSMLRNAEDAITEIPASRWDTDRYQNRNSETENLLATRFGGTVDDVDQFDPHFFGISPREASLLDPQQRLLLEVSHEAMEHAGLASDALKDADVGIFCGLFSHDYELLQVKQNSNSDYDPYFATGNAVSVAAGRLAYVFGFRGPALTVDTACSSSLVAVHLACQSLRQGETSVALAGGVNLLLSPELSLAFSKAGMLSPDGHCKTFDAQADGYVRSEGCGVVVLKPLQQAMAEGDNVIAVIRGSAINHDGASNGLTAPNPMAQQVVIRDALSAAKLAPRQVSYIETHGTATALGDPIEVQALSEVYGEGRRQDNPLVIGSVKTNIGHTEAAAGIAGLIKAALALQHRYIPAHLNFHAPNPLLDLQSIPAEVPREGRVWEPPVGDGARRIAGISSFGFSGTNAHLILEEPPLAAGNREGMVRSACPLPLSTRTATALDELIQRYSVCLGESGTDFADIAATAATGRNHFQNRVCVMADNSADAARMLDALVKGEKPEDVFVGSKVQGQAPRVAFMFTGQGSQTIGMGRELYETRIDFRRELDCCEALLEPCLDVSLLDVMFNAAEQGALLHQTAYTQPALFAIEYAMARLWQSWGVEPSIVMGHSVGEYVAACIAGVMNLEDACRLIAGRGRLMQNEPPGGAMAAIFTDAQRVSQVLSPYRGRVSVAAINGPEHTVISGDTEAVSLICEQLETDGVGVQPLQVSHAFHSPLMEPMLDEFRRIAESIAFNAPQISCISNLTGEPVGEEIAKAEYWVRHVREPVQFAAGVAALEQTGVDVYLEVGPKPVLTGMARRCLPESNARWLCSMYADASAAGAESGNLMRAAAALYATGVDINWHGVYAQGSFRKVTLPTYPFERKRYWLPEKTAQRRPASTSGTSRVHPLLGTPIVSASKDRQFENWLSARSPEYLADHCVFQQPVVPATAYIEMAFAAARDLDSKAGWSLKDVTFERALSLTDDGSRHIQLILSPPGRGDDAFECKIYSRLQSAGAEAPEWLLHASARLSRNTHEHEESQDITALRAGCARATDIEAFYENLAQRHYGYGTAFRAVKQLWHGDAQALARIELPGSLLTECDDYNLHPVLLDASFQTALSLSHDATLVPVSVEQVVLMSLQETSVWAHAHITSPSAGAKDSLSADVRLLSADGRCVANLKGVRFSPTNQHALLQQRGVGVDDLFYRVAWRNQPLPVADTEMAGLLAAPDQLGQSLVESAGYRDAQNGLEQSSAILTALESLTVQYVICALRQLGQSLSAGAQFTHDDLATQLGVVAKQRKQLGRLLDMLAEEKWLVCEDGIWKVLQSCPDVRPDEQLANFQVRYPAAASELAFIGRCGDQLASALRGECDVLQLLFPEGELGEAASFYTDSLAFKTMNRLVAESVAEAVRRLPVELPGGRPLRLLELGAGTGGLSAHILLCLADRPVEYVFTDVSNLFLNKARERFSDHPFVQYRLLDIERRPVEQDFTTHHYDIVVAANVLHATQNLGDTLTHVKELLAPGGLLVLLEGTAKRRWIDLIFGLTEGWWRFNDQGRRAAHPLMTDEQWTRCLEEQGFASSTTICPDHTGEHMLFRQSLIIAQTDSTDPAPEGRWLIYADQQGYGKRLAEHLASHGGIVTLVQAGEDYQRINRQMYRIRANQPEDHQRLFSELFSEGALRGVVFLWPLDSGQPDSAMSAGVEGLADCGYGSLLHLVQSLLANSKNISPRLWLVTRQAQAVLPWESVSGVTQAPVWGVGKILTLEHPELSCSRVDLGPDTGDGDVQALFEELRANTSEDQIALRHGVRRVARLVSETLEDTDAENGASMQRLDVTERGTLDHLQYCEVARRAPGPGEMEIRVRASGLNFRDVLNALGRYPGDPGLLGDECAGEVVSVGEGVEGFSPGDRVMATAPGSFADYVTFDAQLAVPLPGNMRYTDAATVPVVFLTTYYALHHLARIKPGDRVLIHAATGGVGQAAIQIAQQAGAEVYGTASPGKWDVLRSLGVKYIMNSRELDFADAVLEATDGQGVDIAINCLAGEFIPRTLSVLADDGRFIEIGKAGIWTAGQVAELKPGVSYFVLDLLQVRKEQPQLIRSMLTDLAVHFEDGRLSILPQALFSFDEAYEAFRYMQQARHTGKIVLVHPINFADECKPVSCSANASYLISGGLGGLGLLVAGWLVSQGARHLVLLGRSGADDQALQRIEALERAGATVRVEKADVCDSDRLAEIISGCSKSGHPLRGVIHAVGVLDDGAIILQDEKRFRKVMMPKIEGAWNLHQLSEGIPLDFFILFSSTASLLGTPGQANHAAANAFLDQLAHYRRANGFPAMSINWGAWSGIGAAAREDVGAQWEGRGINSISPSQGISAFARMFKRMPVQIGVAPINWQRYLQQVDGGCSQTFYADMTVNNDTAISSMDRADETQSIDQIHTDIRSGSTDSLICYLSQQVSRVLRLDRSFEIKLDLSLNELGLDSLTGIELRNRINTDLGVQIPLNRFFDRASLTQWSDSIVEFMTIDRLAGDAAAGEDKNYEEVML